MTQIQYCKMIQELRSSNFDTTEVHDYEVNFLLPNLRTYL